MNVVILLACLILGAAVADLDGRFQTQIGFWILVIIICIWGIAVWLVK